MTSGPLNVDRLSRSQVSRLFAIAMRDKNDRGDDASEQLQRVVRDRGQLKQLIGDLKSPLVTADQGPLSFQRITRLTDDQANSLRGQSLVQALTSSRTGRDVLEALRHYGEVLSQPILPKATRATGAVVKACAQAMLLHRFGVAMEIEALRDIERLLRQIAGTVEMPRALRECAAQSTSQP